MLIFDAGEGAHCTMVPIVLGPGTPKSTAVRLVQVYLTKARVHQGPYECNKHQDCEQKEQKQECRSGKERISLKIQQHLP